MALKKFYIGSTGPFYYNDEEALPEDRNLASPRLQTAFRGEDALLGDPDNDDSNLESVIDHINDTSIHLNEESVEDIVNGLLTAGSNITLTYDDAANTLTVAASGAGDAIDEAAMNNWFF